MICARAGWLAGRPRQCVNRGDALLSPTATRTLISRFLPPPGLWFRSALAGRRRGASLKPVAPASAACAAECEVAAAGEVDIPVTGLFGGHEPLLAARSLRQDGDAGPVEGGVLRRPGDRAAVRVRDSPGCGPAPRTRVAGDRDRRCGLAIDQSYARSAASQTDRLSIRIWLRS